MSRSGIAQSSKFGLNIFKKCCTVISFINKIEFYARIGDTVKAKHCVTTTKENT